MKYYIIAGEASGDLHAANLMKHLKQEDPYAQFRCWGGDLMQAQGGEVVKHYRDLAFMGFVEVAMNIRTISANLRACKTDLLNFRPDVLILVDYPGFNLRIAEFAYKNGLKVFYYISPQIWAWKQNRVKKIRRFVHRMFVILPFEKAFYEQFHVEVDFVGHPLLDAIAEERRLAIPRQKFLQENQLEDRPLIALLPGSRKQEIASVLPVMLSVIEDFPDYQFVLAAVSSVPESYYRHLIGAHPVKIIQGGTHDLLRNASAALVTSGTATLETALLEIPEVICYKAHSISYQIARRVIKVKYIGLANLIMDRPIVRELIQKDLNTQSLKEELERLLNDTAYREALFANYKALQEKLGGTGASAEVAHRMVQALQTV